MKYIDPVLKQEAVELMSECEYDTGLFASMIFPERFRLAFSDIHRSIFQVLDDDSLKKVLIIAPRGIGKTSIVQLAYPAKRILFQQSKFIVAIEHSATNALLQTETLKEQLLRNSMILKLWGNLKGDWFTKDHWQTSNGVLVLPRGAGQQVRGLLGGDYRPDLIIVDDLEDKDEVMNADIRIKTKRYFMEDVLNAIDEAEPYKVVVIGSLLHEDSLLANILDLTEKQIKEGIVPDWTVLNLAICDNDYNSYWPDKYPNVWIQKKLNELSELGLLDSFSQEYMGLAVSADANFTKELFQHYDERELTQEVKDRMDNIVIIDPAKTIKEGSCSTAIVGWGVDRTAGRYYLRTIDKGMYYPDEIYNRAFYMARQIRANVIGVEVTSLNEFILHPMKQEIVRRGFHYQVLELKARGKKEDRTRMGLLPIYRRKQVWHNKDIAHLIELPLLSFPRCKEWDVIDAATYIEEALEIGEKYLMRAGMKSKEREDAALERLRREDLRKAPSIKRQNVV